MEKINTEPHFGCPGMLTFVIEKIPAGGLLDIIREAVDARKSLILVTDETGTKLRSTPNLDDEFSQTKMVFVERMALQPRLVVLGWTADQEPIFQMAEVLGWRCDRIVKTPEMVAETRTVAGECVTWCAASEVEGSFEPDDQTAFLIMSHHMVTDFNYLKRVLALSYPYVGLLGSQRRKQRLLHELGEQGALEDLSCLESFYAPAGLDIGGSHPTSIALAIIGEIQAVFSQKGAKPIQSLRNA